MDYRTITEEEIDPFFGSLAAAFAEAHPDPDEVRSDRMVLEPDRTFAAFDDGRIVGCAGVFTQRMVVPGGGLVPTSGITFVGVLPTQRRRGIFRELMRRMCAQAQERGEVVTTLFASEAATRLRLHRLETCSERFAVTKPGSGNLPCKPTLSTRTLALRCPGGGDKGRWVTGQARRSDWALSLVAICPGTKDC